MKKIITITVLIILLYIMDSTWVPLFINIHGYSPSLLMIFILSYSIINGSYEGIWVGAFAGILQDVFFIHTFGVNGFINVLLCFLAGHIGKSLFRQKKTVPTVLVGFFTAIKETIIIGYLYIYGASINFYTILAPSIFNLILAFFIYKLIYKLCQKDFMIKEWKF